MIGFGDIDLGFDGDEPAPETLPTPGSATLVVEDRCDALFFSAEWTMVARVGSTILARSKSIDHAHSEAFKRRWARQAIRMNKARLRRLGVDVEQVYVDWGGVLDDLDD